MRTELLLIGDIHLGRLETTFAKHPWEQWSMAPLHQIEEYAITHGIKHAIQSGDVFDTPAPGQHLLRLLATYLFSSRLHWHFGIGNHDISHRGSHSLVFMNYLAKRGRMSNCKFYPKATATKIAGVPTIFLPYPRRKSALLNKRPSLVVAHVDRHGMRYDNGRRISGNKFKLGPHFWAIGHLHTHQTDDCVLFPGAPMQLRYGDSENKYFFHLRIDHNRSGIKVKYKRIRITPSFILRDLIINKPNDAKVLDTAETTTFYRLCIQQNVALPEQYYNHPQVIKHKFFGDKRDLRAIKHEMFNLRTAKLTVTDRLVALKIWLKRNTKLRKSRIRAGVLYAKQRERLLLSGKVAVGK